MTITEQIRRAERDYPPFNGSPTSSPIPSSTGGLLISSVKPTPTKYASFWSELGFPAVELGAGSPLVPQEHGRDALAAPR